MLYATDGMTTMARAPENVYDRMQFGDLPNGLPEDAVYPQFIQHGQGITATVSSPSYMTAIPATLVPVNSVNYTMANSTSTTFANVAGGGVGGMGGVVPVPKMPYTTATLGRPAPRHPGLKGAEPSICAQVSRGACEDLFTDQGVGGSSRRH